MPVQRKVFRIEETTAPASVTAGMLDGVVPADYNEIVAELKALHDLLDRRAPRPNGDIETANADELRRLQVGDRGHPYRAQPHQAGDRGAARQRIRVGAGAGHARARRGGRKRRTRDPANPRRRRGHRGRRQHPVREPQARTGAGARPRHPGQRAAHLRGLQFPGSHRAAHRQGAGDAEIRRGTHRDA